MKSTNQQLWDRFKKYYAEFPNLGLALDVSRMNFGDDFFTAMEPRMQKAFQAMSDLEQGAIANPDEHRMVGHYWLRAPALAPSAEIRREIEETVSAVKQFAGRVHHGEARGANGPFKNLLVIGIGGSALGPQFVAHALGHPATDKVNVFFFDNTDPDGFDRTLARFESNLGQTLCVVISKSGGTKETRNGMIEAKARYEKVGLKFPSHAVAVTGVGSLLDEIAKSEGWLARFPMWDWVGGRTSELSAVGLLPAALQGIDIDAMLAGASACDIVTRTESINDNPSAILACIWNYIDNGKGEKDMVILPYKDRLELFSRYLQQLVMESLGKELDLDRNTVHQGIAVYGNKGSTDQHAYVQQLRDGISNFFVTFIEVLNDRTGVSTEVDPGLYSGDYLNGFLLGTRQALYDKGRESVTITLKKVSPFSVGVLIALFERAVGFYASLVNINAYHQPGVEAGKKAAESVVKLKLAVLEYLMGNRGQFKSLEEISAALGTTDQVETVFKVSEQLTGSTGRNAEREPGTPAFTARYRIR
jgi:glucose-6-phosphate isomerase